MSAPATSISSAMTTTTTTTTNKGGNGSSKAAAGGKNSNFRNRRKIDEVKEIIQNRSDLDISRVLEYFDNDVGKALDAFVTDGGKEALSKWNEKKAKKPNSGNGAQESPAVDTPTESQPSAEDSAKKGAKAGKAAKKAAKQQQQQSQQQTSNSNGASGRGSANRNNINDLVASIINQYTGPTSSTSTAPALAPLSVDSTGQTSQSQQQLVEDLNRLVLGGTATISGLKVTVMGMQSQSTTAAVTNTAGASTHQTQNVVNSTPQTISSVSSSPSSMSSSSSYDTRQLLQSASNGSSMVVNGQRPSLLELKSNGVAATAAPQRSFNRQVNNPRAREMLEKPQKDLQRQSAVLSKIATVFQEEASKGQLLLVQTFSQLHKLLDQRQAHLHAQLMSAVQSGNDLLRQRQAKAADLKLAVDNSLHLTDDETLELKADIKHFVSERQLDEEFGKLKLFDDNCRELIDSIQRMGAVPVISNKYAKQRPPLNELLNGSAASTPAHAPQHASLVNGHSGSKPKLNGNSSHPVDTNNNRSNNAPAPSNQQQQQQQQQAATEDNEGEFIEVKKSRKSKPKPVQPEAPVKPAAAPANKGYAAGNGQVMNGANKPSSSFAKPQRNGEVRAH